MVDTVKTWPYSSLLYPRSAFICDNPGATLWRWAIKDITRSNLYTPFRWTQIFALCAVPYSYKCKDLFISQIVSVIIKQNFYEDQWCIYRKYGSRFLKRSVSVHYCTLNGTMSHNQDISIFFNLVHVYFCVARGSSFWRSENSCDINVNKYYLGYYYILFVQRLRMAPASNGPFIKYNIIIVIKWGGFWCFSHSGLWITSEMAPELYFDQIVRAKKEIVK